MISSWKRLKILNFFLLLALCSACVSVNIKPTLSKKSANYSFKPPGKPFKEATNQQADHAWQSSHTGNTIAVLSECSEDKDLSLSTLEGESIQALNNYQVLGTQEIQYQERGARRSQVEGTVDGIPVQMDLLTFKKNFCSYTLTYVGRTANFQKELPAFEKFLKGFEAP